MWKTVAWVVTRRTQHHKYRYCITFS
uniref:Uncharacterized protein n=1 Tax=Arundo donax TaxID=35708 RepID=A0A0A9BPM0_ARUDO